jgi:uncharacterized membrane protein YfcA
MEVGPVTFLIVCPLCFIAGILNASGGGGGLISLPALMIAGLPPHLAIGTNKLQSSLGMFAANVRYVRNHLLNFRLALVSIVIAMMGAVVGSRLSLLCDERVLSYIVVGVIPVAAFFLFNKRTSPDDGSDTLVLNRSMYRRVCLVALACGLYDGFYGPGTGTFLILGFTGIAHLSVRTASAQAKAINFSTNVTALVMFLANGQVLIPLGLAAGACNIVGAWIGAGLVIKNGARIMKPAICVSFLLLLLKVFGLY